MENWSSKRVPAKYRYLQKHIDEFWKLRKKLPSFSPDFSGLRPEERDLVETFYGCILIATREHKKMNGDFPENKILSVDDELFAPFLRRYLTDQEIKKARDILRSAPRKIYKERDNFWTREERPNLLEFLETQQSIMDWLPKGRLNDKNLTWTSWDELISIAEAYGYEKDSDSINNLKSFKNLKNGERCVIIRIFLEMINSEKTTKSLNALLKDPNKHYTPRNRIYIFRR